MILNNVFSPNLLSINILWVIQESISFDILLLSILKKLLEFNNSKWFYSFSYYQDSFLDFCWIKLLHNGGNDSYIRQSQLWDQIICQTKTAKKFLWNWLVILLSCNSLTNFEFEEEEFCCNLAKRHPYLRWSWERTIDSIR